MNNLRAIETLFLGLRFRSRLEARWGTFLNQLGIPFDYEREGYRLAGGTPYLPDFWLPAQKTFMEIKGDRATQAERTKCQELALGSGCRVALFCGQILEPEFNPNEAAMFFPDGNSDEQYQWCRCGVCGVYGIEFSGYSGRICAHGRGKGWNSEPTIILAYRIARSARFEHGESPRPKKLRKKRRAKGAMA